MIHANLVRTQAANLCDTPRDGYQCAKESSHFWGQYSPIYRVDSPIPDHTPSDCSLTFAQVLSRHGARDPTMGKTLLYSTLITRIKTNVKSFTGKYAFLASYNYSLGADQLTTFGQQQLVNEGIFFYERYKELTKEHSPFVRSAGQARVVESARNWTQGFQSAKLSGGRHQRHAKSASDPYPILVISEDDGVNNTLSDTNLCPKFSSAGGSSAQATHLETWVRPVLKRLNSDLPNANVTAHEVIYLMDLCSFSTISAITGYPLSPFCSLFSEDEWHSYDYFQSLGKWYGYGNGNPLGATRQVGWVNELIARLTQSAVIDHTTVNHTLDSNPATFPIGEKHKLFADFSHDNDMTNIIAALGLYNGTSLPVDSTVPAEKLGGYSASWTVPFAGRLYVEKYKCSSAQDELVRVVVNGRVNELKWCKGASAGLCLLENFVSGLSFARAGGLWQEKCFS